jgi:hypothetical protein
MLGSTNGTTYGAASTITIPVGAAGWHGVGVVIQNANPSHDQTITVISSRSSSLLTGGVVAEFNLPPTASLRFGLGSTGAVGQGGIAGGATAVNYAYYSVPALEGVSQLNISLSAGTTPSTGSFSTIVIERWT